MNPVSAVYFDGRSSRPQAAQVRVEGDELRISLPEQELRYPLDVLRWPERSQATGRTFLLPAGASLQADADGAWSRLAAAHGIAESSVVRWQQSGWRIALALVLVLVLVGSGLRWGVPLAARAVLLAVPASVDAAIGRQTLIQLDAEVFSPTELSVSQQQQLRARLDAVVRRAWASRDEPPPEFELAFRSSSVGPNAFALPGGSIVLTDELVELADGNLDMVVGVLAHEIGHVEGRHGMRAVAQSLLAATAMAVVLGDASSLLTSAPLVLGSLAYTRDLERQADDHAIALMQANDISPRVMAEFFRKVLDANDVPADDTGNEGGLDRLGLLFSSHPGARERIRKFEDAALR